MPYRPPYTVNSRMVTLTNEINRLIGQLEGYQWLRTNLKLRRVNKIRSLHSSLAIEGNQLSAEQVTAVLAGKRVMGPVKDILEVTNAIAVYDRLTKLDPYSEDELLQTHETLMRGLVPDAGRYRASGVGVVDGERVIHVAPPAKQVPRLMGELFSYLTDYEEDILIKSCVYHYEFEFIHPFSDGNGRMGRLWQTALLKTVYPDLAFVPIESMVYARQAEYYAALAQSGRDATADAFILYSLSTVRDAVREQLNNLRPTAPDADDRLRAFAESWPGGEWFTRTDYRQYHKTLAPATATRDLRSGVDTGLLERAGKLRTVRYRFVR